MAQADTRIRAVILNGFRANPQAKRDRFSDFDIIYVVQDIATFLADTHWIDRFGKRVMLQTPETMRDPIGDGRFVYLILFSNHARLDLTLIPIEKMTELLESGSQSILWLDKDSIIGPFSAASDRDYWLKKPSRIDFESCCNNFWWCTQNVAKGIAREKWSYALGMLHEIVRAELHHMLDWSIGVRREFKVSTGKWGQDYDRFLPPDTYGKYLKTYPQANRESMWQALFLACALFRDPAQDLANRFGYNYSDADDRRMSTYLNWLKNEV